MILTGWGFPAFNHLRDTVRGRGGRIVAMVDNCWKGNARQWVGAVYARLKLRSKIDAVWVPGASAESLCRRFGWPAKRIYRSLYSALDGFTASPEPLSRRPKTFLFVGQLIPRKGVDTLARAWQAAGLAEAGWTLEVCGAGPAQSVFDGIAGVRLTGFLQPAELPAVFQRSRWFVLPAREEHWGLVVHEAARAGCGLLLSDQVGARHEFLEPGRSGWCFAAGNPDSLAASLRQAAAGSGEAIDSLGRRALELGSGISTRTHVASFQRLSREVFGIDASLLR
jgi:glycosyltransferase involved in cell wall biosynthesis